MPKKPVRMERRRDDGEERQQSEVMRLSGMIQQVSSYMHPPAIEEARVWAIVAQLEVAKQIARLIQFLKFDSTIGLGYYDEN